MQVPNFLLKYFDSTIKDIFANIEDEIIFAIKNEIFEYSVRELKYILNAKTFLERDTPINFLEIYFPIDIKKKNSWINALQARRDELVQFSIVQGNAGSGKSMFAKSKFIDVLKNEKRIPIFLELRYLKNEKLLDFINSIFLFNKIATNVNISDRLLKSGKVTLILDGFDEVDILFREELLNEINMVCKRYNAIDILITSRPEVNLNSLGAFTTYDLLELEEKQIEPFVERQLINSSPNDTEQILCNIRNADKNFKVYFKNPLFLCMYILTYKNFPETPDSKFIFYEQLFDTLYYRHDKVNKLSFKRKKITSLKKNKFEELLNSFSYTTLKISQTTFSKSQLEKNLDFCKNHMKDFSAIENEDIIEDLVVNINILYKEGHFYSFPHKSIQEYFSAKFIYCLTEQNKEIVYTRISNEILKNNINVNYLILLFEIDTVCFKKYLILPLLKQLIELKYSVAPYRIQEEIYLNISSILNNGLVSVPKQYHFNNTAQLRNELLLLKNQIVKEIEDQKKII
ncbi:MAG: NACHT domain-containing protein [Bacteroidetes bacterium]|nr:NACHT domain-containing protein [Bacteroidota bacterium]